MTSIPDSAKVYRDLSTAHRLVIEESCKILEGSPVDNSKIFDASTLIASNMNDLYKILTSYSNNRESFSNDMYEGSVIQAIVMKGLLLDLDNLIDSDIIGLDDDDEFSGLSLRAQKNIIKTALFWMEKYKGTLNEENS